MQKICIQSSSVYEFLYNCLPGDSHTMLGLTCSIWNMETYIFLLIAWWNDHKKFCSCLSWSFFQSGNSENLINVIRCLLDQRESEGRVQPSLTNVVDLNSSPREKKKSNSQNMITIRKMLEIFKILAF